MPTPSPDFYYLLIILVLVCLLCLFVFPTVAVEGGRARHLLQSDVPSLAASSDGSSFVLRSQSEQMLNPFSEKFFSYSVITFPSPSGEA